MSVKTLKLPGKSKDLGGVTVSRFLPQVAKRSLGPFVFLDLMGPVKVDDQHKLDVRPHPHIGLATVTYLFEGRGLHRDSLGSEQVIEPGDINLMTAGRGIVHSERTPSQDLNKSQSHRIWGAQFWVALPIDQEECEPSFNHYPKANLPEVKLAQGAVSGRLMIGEYAGKKSPVKTYSPLLFMDFSCSQATNFELSFLRQEVGFFQVQGEAIVSDQVLSSDFLLVPEDAEKISVQMKPGDRFLVFGGEPLAEPRHMWWNFVSSRKERIHQAAKAWESQQMGKVPQETEWIPLPKDPLP